MFFYDYAFARLNLSKGKHFFYFGGGGGGGGGVASLPDSFTGKPGYEAGGGGWSVWSILVNFFVFPVVCSLASEIL